MRSVLHSANPLGLPGYRREEIKEGVANGNSPTPSDRSTQSAAVQGVDALIKTSVFLTATDGSLAKTTTAIQSNPENPSSKPSRAVGESLSFGHTSSGKAQTFQDGQADGLRVLCEPRDASRTIVDIVFIHGLTGSSKSTWLEKKSGIYWPVDLLVEDVPTTWILAFDYDVDVAKVLGAVSQSNLRNHAEALLSDLAAARDDANTVSTLVVSFRNRRIIEISHLCLRCSNVLVLAIRPQHLTF
jgi:hypothetical protein